MKMEARVGALERKITPSGLQFLHLVGKTAGQTKDEALEDYGRDKIAEADGIIWLHGFEDPDFEQAEPD